MATQKNRIKIFIVISIIISILAFLVIIGWYILFPIYFAMNYANSNEPREMHTKLNGNVVHTISDSLKNEKWEHNIPKNWNNNFYKNDTIYQRSGYFFIKKTDSTENIVIKTSLYNVIYIDVVYIDTMRFYFRNMTKEQRRLFEKLLSQTVFKDIEKEAKRQNLPNSVIYLPKEQLEKYGYYEFAKKIYPH